ncbi:MAG TPA: NUDIX hydrolase [Ktedonobacterales bacterium]|nr:NUDIX hydrolase [Ktedonobacterales bacterium]
MSERTTASKRGMKKVGTSRSAAAGSARAARPRARTIYTGKLITIRQIPVTHADGSTTPYEIVGHPDAVAIVAIRYDPAPTREPYAEPRVALVRQRRPAVGKDLLEIPAGLVEPEERDHPDLTAVRELREETGFLASDWQLLTRVFTSPGFTNEAISIYLARSLEQIPGAAPDPHEIDSLEWMPLAEALNLVRDGAIDDSKSVIGLLLARDALGR